MPASLIIHGSPMSTCVQRVLLTAAELDVQIDLVDVDFAKGEHKSEAYMKFQPFGAVPYLEDTEAGITFYEWVTWQWSQPAERDRAWTGG